MIRAKAPLDYEHILALRNYPESKKYRKTMRIILGFLIILFGYLVYKSFSTFTDAAIRLIYNLAQDYPINDSRIISGLISIVPIFVIGNLIVIFNLIKSSVAFVKLFIKPKKPKYTAVYDYTFSDEDFGFVIEINSSVVERHRRYESIKGVTEYKEWYYVNLCENEFSIIKKNELIDTTPEEFSAFMRKKIGTRFKVEK